MPDFCFSLPGLDRFRDRQVSLLYQVVGMGMLQAQSASHTYQQAVEPDAETFGPSPYCLQEGIEFIPAEPAPKVTK